MEGAIYFDPAVDSLANSEDHLHLAQTRPKPQKRPGDYKRESIDIIEVQSVVFRFIITSLSSLNQPTLKQPTSETRDL